MELFAQTTNIVPALIAARRAFKTVIKDAPNRQFTGSKYAKLDGVIDAINEALLANGIFLTQTTYVKDAQTMLRTMLLHTSGESIHGDYPVHPVKPDPQAEGSAFTYARRYALMGLVGIAPEEDDDGNAASAGRAAKKPMSTQAIHEAGVHPTGGVLESLTATELERAQKIATTALEYFEANDAAGAYAYLTERAFNEGDGADMKTAVKALFPKEYLKALKALSEQPTRRAA